MPRFCVICGKSQSHSFSVFSFPRFQKKKNAWLDVILKVKPEYFEDKRVIDNKVLKNGVCELHFFQSEISNGKKRRLDKDAIPTLDIPASGKCFSALRKYSTFLINEKEDYPSLSTNPYNSDNETIGSEISLIENKLKFSNEISLPDCTIEIEDKNSSPRIYKSSIETIFNDEKRKEVCLCCGCENNTKTLFSILKAKSSKGNYSLVEEISTIFRISQEKVISLGCFICCKCLKIIEDILNIKYTLSSLISYINNIFWKNNSSNSNNCEKESIVNVEDSERLEKELSSSSKGVRKSCRIQPALNKFSCTECFKEFTSLSNLYIHSTSHDEDICSSKVATARVRKYHCTLCDKIFISKSLLSLHLKSHSGVLNCEYCGRLITSKSRLNAHMKKFHGIGEEKERSFQCKSCAKTFSTRGGLRYHEFSWHKKGKSLTCEICFKVFSYPMSYKNHKLFVHGNKNILCDICGEMFFNKSKLNIHINAVHIKALTWSCKICNEKFTTSALYKHHVMIKHKRLIYSCSHCTAQFRKKSTLVQHMWLHGNYLCQKCNLKYTDASSFVSHMLEIHNVDIYNKVFLKSQLPIINRSGEIPDTLNKACDTSKKDDDSSVVINDILMASNEFENSTLQTLSFPASNRVREESSKFDELSSVEAIPFDNVEALEMQTVPNDSMELEDVSLINVQMLQEIEHQHTNVKSIKEPLSSEKEESLSILHGLESDVMPENPVYNSSEINSSIIRNNPDDSSLDEVEIIKNISTELEEDLTKTSLIKSNLEQSDLPHLPVILQPVKNSRWSFSNSLGTRTSTSVNSVIHSLTVDKVSPNTREIDTTIPPEGEAAKIPIPNEIKGNNNGKLQDQNLSSLSVNIDEKVDVRYVMYFKTQAEKE